MSQKHFSHVLADTIRSPRSVPEPTLVPKGEGGISARLPDHQERGKNFLIALTRDYFDNTRLGTCR